MKYILFIILISITAITFAELPAGHPSLPDTTKAKQSSSDPLPNEGHIKNIIQSGGYTYIEVEKDGAKEWLAAPHIKLEKGDNIRYSSGAVMSDFYSKTLERTFSKILFVGNIKVVKQ